MAVDSSPNLMDVLQQLELLTPAQLDELRGQSPVDPDELAESLVRRGWLTSFQVGRIRKGRGGELVLGNYVLLDQLGEGGMGQVYKARHRRMGRVVALKVIARKQLEDSESVRRFQREIEAAAQLEHPNVVRAYDADQAGDVHFFVMEFVEGIDLGKLVRQRGPLPIEEASTYIRQVAHGLQHAYERGLVHRDIKPSNLLLSSREGIVKILDLGLARWERSVEGGAEPPTLTRDGAMMGTPDFIAPEQARDAHSADIRSDLYSLGCTFYYLLSGKVPFPGGSLAQKIYKQQFGAPVPLTGVRPDVPSSVASVVYRLMAKEPSDRYQTPAEVIADLPPLGEGSTLNTSSARVAGVAPLVPDPFVSQGTPLQVVEVSRRPPRRPRRSHTLAFLFGGLMALAFGGLLTWKMLHHREGTTGGADDGSVVKPGESPAQAAEALRKLGAVVTTASDAPASPIVTIDCSDLAIHDEELAHLAALPTVEKLYLYNTPVGDAGLASVRELSGLQLLGLGRTRVSDAALSHLRGLRRLQVLWLGQTRVTDTGMVELAALTGLRRLHLGGTRIGDAGVRNLHDLTQLVELELRDTAVGNAGLAHLAEMRGLQSLDLTNTSVDDAGLAHLAGLAELRHLKLAGCKVGDAGLRHLSGLHQLRTLDLTDTIVTAAGVRTLQDALPGVKITR